LTSAYIVRDGSTTTIKGMRYHVFTSSGTLTVIRGGVIYAMIVAAGGSPRSHASIIANGANGGGGGGGGGLLNYLPVVVPEGSYQTVTIGTSALKSRGGNSSVTCLRPATATGGGTSGNNQLDGLENGGSGGGQNFQAGVYGGAIGQGNTPSLTPSQGNNGGAGQDDGAVASQAGGGGGFTGAAGTYDSGFGLRIQDGGQGLALSEVDPDTFSLDALISNNTHFSSGGGGAGNVNSGNSQGRGGTGAGNGAYASDATSASMYGCGGGGGANSSDTSTLGFQGIVIIRYPIN